MPRSVSPPAQLVGEAALRALAELELFGLAHADPDGRVLSINRRLRELLGLSESEPARLTLDALVQRGGASLHVVPVRDQAGELQAQLAVLVEEREGAVDDDFLALLAHELRNPLGALRNGLSVMQLAAADEQAVGRARSIMERQVAHMVRLIDESLDVSRMRLQKSGPHGPSKLQLHRVPVALAEVVTSAVEMARQAIDAGEHRLDVSLPETFTLIDADPTRLAQVFGNLLTNAAKYTPKGGHIALRAELSGSGLVVVVEDDGIGLQPESLGSIFGLYSRGEHGSGRRTAGLGIGLALARGLTELHGGTVHAESAGRGQGSRFVVRLPGLLLSEAPPQQERAERAASGPPGRRILVIDDDLDALESTAALLRLAGSAVDTAQSGLEALERAESEHPDVVLLDLAMPDLDGFELARRIRRQDWGRGVVLIALSGLGREPDLRRSREAGCDEHLVKPVPFERLQQLIEALCTRPSGSRLVSAAALSRAAKE